MGMYQYGQSIEVRPLFLFGLLNGGRIMQCEVGAQTTQVVKQCTGTATTTSRNVCMYACMHDYNKLLHIMMYYSLVSINITIIITTHYYYYYYHST